jgi:hypothetical protein
MKMTPSQLKTNIINTLILSIIIVSSSLINNAYASGEYNLQDQIKETVKFKHGELPMEKSKENFVKVSFTINKVGRLEILNLNYSDEKIKDLLIEKLSEIIIKGNFNSEEVHNYNFSFINR